MFGEQRGTALVITLMSRVIASAEIFEQGWSPCYMGCTCERCVLARDVRSLRRAVSRLS